MGNGKTIKMRFILLIIISLFISFACQSAEDDVSIDYEVEATVSAPPCLVDITYSDSDGRIVQLLDQTILPDTLVTSFTVPGDEVTDFLVFLMAQLCSTAADVDTITVTIKRDGLIFLEATDQDPSTSGSISGNL